MNKNYNEAKDITQETFLKILKKINDIVYSSDLEMKSYILKTAYHIMLNSKKRERKMVDFEQVDKDNYCYTPQNAAPYLKEILNKALNKLPEIQRKVFLMRHHDGYSYKEITEITGLKEPQVKVYIHRAKSFLQKDLGSIENLI